MEFLFHYGLFLAKAATFVVVALIIVAIIGSLAGRNRSQTKGRIETTNLNEQYQEMFDSVEEAILSPQEYKDQIKEREKEKKQALKAKKKKSSKDSEDEKKKRLFVLDFDGDIKASDVDKLKQSISAVLHLARDTDEVLVRLESGGGMVHSYGLASSQLDRIRQQGIPLTVSVDKIAASGGYMMACVADKIISAPFAIIGSIGVVAQLPNFHRLLKKNDVDFEMLTAGEYKRTLTMFGENTDKGREKFVEDLEKTHDLFKTFVSSHRSKVDIAEVATGEVWYGQQALDIGLVDEINTSDSYITDQLKDVDVIAVDYVSKKSLVEKMGSSVAAGVDQLALKWVTRLFQTRPQA
ncbi:protease SohB [Sessilibacter corallicola]|uniref:protease SohB n=1 Tax=Sessilibacter corallicola TaxID=2904075 RepID=UPI001E5656AE|nr:protease SohB [Sessilibacter corallicola]MCE2029875.1 protease SohB [Sessilibacter corallicola]